MCVTSPPAIVETVREPSLVEQTDIKNANDEVVVSALATAFALLIPWGSVLAVVSLWLLSKLAAKRRVPSAFFACLAGVIVPVNLITLTITCWDCFQILF